MVTRRVIEGDALYFCEECGFGYRDEKTAEECERWCSDRKSCNLEITKRAIYIPGE